MASPQPSNLYRLRRELEVRHTVDVIRRVAGVEDDVVIDMGFDFFSDSIDVVVAFTHVKQAFRQLEVHHFGAELFDFEGGGRQQFVQAEQSHVRGAEDL